MKSVLIINESSLLRGFLERQLTEYGFEVSSAINGLDGWTKVRQEKPDGIIMDYHLSRMQSADLLKAIQQDPNLPDIPVVMTASKLEKPQLVEIARLGVRKILSKPVRIDSLLAALTGMLNVAIEVDQTPCILDAHLNDQILFVEIARGFNREKISLLRYKIAELMRLYSVEDPRILVLLTDIEFKKTDGDKLREFLEETMGFVQSAERIRILTVSSKIKEYVTGHPVLRDVEVCATLEEAMDGLLGIKGMESLTAEQNNVQDRFFSSKQELQREAFQLNFASESPVEIALPETSARVAVVDDDMIVREIVKNSFVGTGWHIAPFSNGVEFMEALERGEQYDLLFLDLVMPEMNGFAVLQMLQGQELEIPTIILTGLSRKESVMKAREFGVTSYLIKPIKPDGILTKATEILGTNF
ncbi:MAG: response regulator [Spirochaetales bacterium]|nr:response regulator [Spirochaetales bacterium]